MPEKYDHIDFKPPAGVRAEAKKGLEWRDEYNRGGTMVGVARARDLSNGKNISPDTAKRMNSYFARHAVDKKGEGWSPGQDGFPSAGRIAWALWGGDAGEAWSGKLVRQMEAADKAERSLPMKTKKLKSWKSDELPSQKMILRMVSVRAETANAETKSVQVVIASENPVERYDLERDYVIQEILLMDGVEFRTDRMQLPIVDSHDRSTVRNVLGSVRNIRIDGSQLVGDATFARDSDSQDAYQKLLDGHLTDFSITATPKQVLAVRRGETYNLRGQTIEGPADIVTRWMPTDASLVAAGADETSTVRDLQRSYFFQGEDSMKRALTEEMKAILVAKGMPEEIEDADQALAYVVGMMSDGSKETEEPEMEMADAMTDEVKQAMKETVARPNYNDDEKKMAEGMDSEEEIEKTVNRALKEDAKRRREIVATCEKLQLERSFADELCDKNVSLDDARKLCIERAANKPLGQQGAYTMKVTESEVDKFYSAAKAGLLQRTQQSAGVRRMKVEDAPGAEDFRYAGLRQLAEAFVERMGGNVRRMAPKDIALAAMGHYPTMQRHGIQRDAYHTTGSFSNLLLDAANKTLLAGYEEAPYTWSQWARQGTSVADFKAINRIRFSEVGNPEMVPEAHEYPESKMSDSKESYKIDKYGSIFTVTWETVVNDDLDAISRIPAMQGASCRRKQNASVYGVLTANAAMADSGLLFNSTAQTTAGGHANLATSGAVTVANLSAGFLSMMTKKGLGTSSDAILNIVPAVLIVPAAVSATALQVVTSISDPNVGGNTAGNANTINIYGPNGSRSLTVVVEPVLDANSATAWYLAASPTQVDTVEITFLQGEEAPVLENEWNFHKDVYEYKVRQTWGVAAIDYRGLYKSLGT